MPLGYLFSPMKAWLGLALALTACGGPPPRAPNPTRPLDERRAIELIIQAFREEKDNPVPGTTIALTESKQIHIDVGAKERVIDILFTDRKLQKACTEDRDGQRRWGANWKILKRRLATLAAAVTLADMSSAPGRCHALTANRAGQYALHLWEPYRLVFEPAEPLLACDPNGGIDLKKVTVISILEIIDYHGS